MLQKCLCTLARFVRCRLFRSLWTLFIASVRVVILSFQFRAAPLILNVTSMHIKLITSALFWMILSAWNYILCLGGDAASISAASTGCTESDIFSHIYILYSLHWAVIIIHHAVFWFIPWRLDLHLYSHIDYSALWKSLHCVELFFLCAATLPVWFLICVAKQWLPGKSLSYISHWFP